MSDCTVLVTCLGLFIVCLNIFFWLYQRSATTDRLYPPDETDISDLEDGSGEVLIHNGAFGIRHDCTSSHGFGPSSPRSYRTEDTYGQTLRFPQFRTSTTTTLDSSDRVRVSSPDIRTPLLEDRGRPRTARLLSPLDRSAGGSTSTARSDTNGHTSARDSATNRTVSTRSSHDSMMFAME